jgi:hypothetical protein
MGESEVTVICLESFSELYGGLLWAGRPGLDTVLPAGLATRLEGAHKVRVITPHEPKLSARASKANAEKE